MSRLGGWSQVYETERKPTENPPIHGCYFPTVYFPIMIDKVSAGPSTFATICTLDVPGRKQLIVTGVTGELEWSKCVETIAYKVVIVTGYESTQPCLFASTCPHC